MNLKEAKLLTLLPGRWVVGDTSSKRPMGYSSWQPNAGLSAATQFSQTNGIRLYNEPLADQSICFVRRSATTRQDPSGLVYRALLEATRSSITCSEGQ